MVATHSESRKICLYRVHIKWDPAQWDQSQTKQTNSVPSFPTPSFQFIHSKVETPSAIFHTQKDSMGDMNDVAHNNTIFCLTHLEIITCPTDGSGNSSTAPYIMGVFSVPVHALDNHHSEQGSSSVIVRWQLDTTAQNLHASFDDVVSKKPKVQIKVFPPVYFL
jgi:mediator of RNA polymerase II transcription subunit 16